MAAYIPPTEQLLAFTMAVTHRSFTVAAHELNITQSAVSHQVARLEKAMGIRLINRSARGLALTDAGEALMAAIADPIARLLTAFEAHVVPASANLLRIQVESAFSASWLAPRLDDFLQQFPGLRFEQFSMSNQRLSEDVDLGVKWGNGHWPDLNAEKLLSIYNTPICSAALLTSGKLRDPTDLRHFTLLHDRKHADWRQWLDQYGIRHPDIKRGHVVHDSYVLTEMAIEGRGVAMYSPMLIRRELASGLLVCPFPEMRMYPNEAYHLVVRKGTQMSRSAEAFAGWLKKQVAVPE